MGFFFIGVKQTFEVNEIRGIDALNFVGIAFKSCLSELVSKCYPPFACGP